MSDTHREVKKYEIVKECPCCGEGHFARSLYNHVAYSDDEEHGARGEVPENFTVAEAKTLGRREITYKESKPDTEAVRCKFCGEDFRGQHGLRIHLSQTTPDPEHPEGLNPDTAGIAIPWTESTLPNRGRRPTREDRTTEAAKQFHARLDAVWEETENDSSENRGEPAWIPREAVEDLLDDLRMKEPEGACFVTSARMVEQLIEEHATNPDQIPQ
jgi:hypothetical protein